MDLEFRVSTMSFAKSKKQFTRGAAGFPISGHPLSARRVVTYCLVDPDLSRVGHSSESYAS